MNFPHFFNYNRYIVNERYAMSFQSNSYAIQSETGENIGYIQQQRTTGHKVAGLFVGKKILSFHNIFKKSLKLSPKKYINNLRVEKAKYLLQTTNLPIDEIGFECGFLNHVYFSYAFKKVLGITATEYRNMKRY